MTRFKIILLGGITVAAIAILVVAGLFSRSRPQETSGVGAGGYSTSMPQAAPQPNAFLPSVGQGGHTALGGGTAPSGASSGSAFIPKIPSLDEIQNVISSAVSPPSITSTLLALPAVLDSELTVSSDGAVNTRDYLTYLVLHAQDAKFDFTKLGEIVTSTDTAPPSLTRFIDQALTSGNYAAVKDKIAILRELDMGKIGLEGNIKVATSGIEVARNAMALDKLTLDLIDRFTELQTGTLSRSEFDDFYGKYKNTVAFYARQFLGGAGILAKNDSGQNGNYDFVSWISHLFGLNNRAEASPPLIGGMVSIYTPCTCLYLMAAAYGAILVGPPDPGTFAISPFSMLYMNYMPFSGHWVLGLDVPVPIPCLEQALFICVPSILPGTLGPVLIMGTS